MTSAQVAETYGWNIGDTIDILLTNGVTMPMRIIGFNHDELSDGSGKAGITLDMTRVLGSNYVFSTQTGRYGGWYASAIRAEMPTIKELFPIEWQDNMKTVKKYSARQIGNSNIDTTDDDLFLLSVIEVGGTGETSKANNGAQEGTQYEYYKNNSWIKQFSSWSLRSCGADSSRNCCVVSIQGRITTIQASNSKPQNAGFAFCV